MAGYRVTGWLQIGANLAILAGLILVAIQISQTNSLAGYQLNAGNYESLIGLRTAIAGENVDESMYRILYEPETATDRDLFIANAVYSNLLAQVHRLVYLTEAGLSPDNNYEGSLMARSRYFGCAYGIAFLDDFLSGMGPSPQREAVEKLRAYALEERYSDATRRMRAGAGLESGVD
jgi:hypothetical protein